MNIKQVTKILFKSSNMTEEEARKMDEDAATGCAIFGFIIIVTILGLVFL